MTLVLVVNCRACNRECGDYKHLMDEIVTDGASTTLGALLTYCTTVESFVEGDSVSMPEHICNSCVEQLLQAYVFKEMVLQTDNEMREHLKSETAEASIESTQDIEEPAYIEQEIDVGEIEQENSEEYLCNDREEETENAQEKDENEYVMEEWLDIDDTFPSAASDSLKDEVVEEDEEEGADHTSKENFVKIEDGNGTNEDDYIVMEQDYTSDTMEDLRGFEKENELNEEENCEEKSVAEENSPKKVIKRKFVKHSGLTADDLKCKFCGKQYNKMCRLREHTYVHTGEKPHVCKLCGKRSRTKTHYNVHMLTHSDVKRYNCSICGQNYRTSTSLRVHERKHSDIRPYACTICDKKFHTSEQKKMHIMMHTGERPFCCELCGKSYRESHSLKQHMLTHGDKKPFQCEVCGKGLTQMSGYKRHMLLHTNQYPYSCDICGRPFRISSNLVTHRRLHFDVQPYQCTKCNKGFNNSTRLKKHMAQHDQDHTKDTFKPRKPRQETVIVDTKMSKSRVVEIL